MDISFSNFIGVSGYVAGVAGAVFYARSKVPNQTIENYKQLAEAQEKRISALEAQVKVDRQNHLDNIKAIADLQGQLKTYKELPLREMADAMEKISATEINILAILQKSAMQLSVDTDSAAKAVAEVKSDLRTVTP